MRPGPAFLLLSPIFPLFLDVSERRYTVLDENPAVSAISENRIKAKPESGAVLFFGNS